MNRQTKRFLMFYTAMELYLSLYPDERKKLQRLTGRPMNFTRKHKRKKP